MDVLSEAREQGIIRAHGVSCHSFGALKTAAASDWVQVDLARVNPAGAYMDNNPAAVTDVLREMKAKGKAIIGMKVLGAGQLAGKADECFQWALAQDCVDCFTLGMKSPAEVSTHAQADPGGEHAGVSGDRPRVPLSTTPARAELAAAGAADSRPWRSG